MGTAANISELLVKPANIRKMSEEYLFCLVSQLRARKKKGKNSFDI